MTRLVATLRAFVVSFYHRVSRRSPSVLPSTRPSSELSPDQVQAYIEHLKFLGYTVASKEDGWWSAEHPIRSNLWVRPIAVGVRLSSSWEIGKALPGGRREWLEFMNSANSRSLFATFFLDTADNVHRIRVAGVFGGGYDARQFGLAMDAWERDANLLRDAPWPPPPSRDEELANEKPASTMIN